MIQSDTLSVLDAMPQAERFDVLCDAWDRLFDSGWQPDVDEETRDLLDERIRAAESKPNDVVSWEEMVSRITGVP